MIANDRRFMVIICICTARMGGAAVCTYIFTIIMV